MHTYIHIDEDRVGKTFQCKGNKNTQEVTIKNIHQISHLNQNVGGLQEEKCLFDP